MLKVEFQYVNECPRVKEMATNIKSAISEFNLELQYNEIILNAESNSEEVRGCPTLLVNGRDLVGKLKCDVEEPFCRTYKNGTPSVEKIKKFIQYNC